MMFEGIAQRRIPLGRSLFAQRFLFEQSFDHLTKWGGGLKSLPPWARPHRTQASPLLKDVHHFMEKIVALRDREA